MIAPNDYMITCINKKLFGFECMGCGGQRSLSLLFQGEFIEAFKMYPAIYTLLPFFVVVALNFIFKFKNANKIISALAIMSVTLIIINYIYKLTN